MRKIFILPNLFTAGSLFCGMLAIFEVFNGDPNSTQQACLLILLSALLDVADGTIARLTGSTSSFGLHFDSLSDLVAFGVAPALLAYSGFGGTFHRLAAAVCSLYVVCGALRLARFNVQAAREERKSFSGLPIPGAALATVSVIWVFAEHRAFADWLGRIIPDLTGDNPLAPILPPLLVVIAYLMVSKVPFYGFKSMNLGGHQPFEILVTIVVIAFLLYMLKDNLDIVLAVLAWGYIIGGLCHAFLGGRKRQAADETQTFPNPHSSPSNRSGE